MNTKLCLRRASDARVHAEAMTVALAEAHIAAVVEAIEEALIAGKFETELYLAREMHPVCLRQLKNAGYWVSQRTEDQPYRISWRVQ